MKTNEKKRLRINKGMVVLVPNKSKTRGSIILPDAYFDTSVCQIYEVGEGCHKMIRSGSIALVSAKFTERAYQILDKNSGMFICEARHIFGVVKRGRVYPVRKMICVERLVNEDKFSGTIVIPEAHKTTDQSLNVIMYGYGITEKGQTFDVKGIKTGAKLRLKKWEEHMVEVGFDGKYYLFVKEEDVICEIK